MAIDVDAFLDGLEGDVTPAPALDTDPGTYPVNPPEFAREGYQWAADVFWVYDHLGEKKRPADASPGRWAMLKEANKDISYFCNQLMPKAMPLFERARDRVGSGDVVVSEERKGINELQRILVAAREESAALTKAGRT